MFAVMCGRNRQAPVGIPGNRTCLQRDAQRKYRLVDSQYRDSLQPRTMVMSAQGSAGKILSLAWRFAEAENSSRPTETRDGPFKSERNNDAADFAISYQPPRIKSEPLNFLSTKANSYQ
jgi:hypothetical protein